MVTLRRHSSQILIAEAKLHKDFCPRVEFGTVEAYLRKTVPLRAELQKRTLRKHFPWS